MKKKDYSSRVFRSENLEKPVEVDLGAGFGVVVGFGVGVGVGFCVGVGFGVIVVFGTILDFAPSFGLSAK